MHYVSRYDKKSPTRYFAAHYPQTRLIIYFITFAYALQQVYNRFISDTLPPD